ncbi:MAG: 2-hydroxychromene-2-carboxylate isomerase [Nevskia sp.]|nr:2-hydroxychromene-2-carboxylate isomerase [Nevskia sp.]
MQTAGNTRSPTVERTMDRTVEFFWDPASPYTYLASTQVEALAARVGATVVWKPFLLGKVFEATGNKMPAAIPAKGKHLFCDVQRWAAHYGVPVAFPKVFPVNSVLALRAGIAAANLGQAAAFAKALMKAYWADGLDIGQPEAVGRVAAAAGLDGAAVLALTQEQPVKDQLRANTEEAVKRGAFGAPTFFVSEEMFWGNDRLVLLEEFLRGRLAA